MDVFFEVKFLVRILYVITLFTASMFRVEAVKIECIKSDECSCKTNGIGPPKEISLWPMKSANGILSDVGNWQFDFNLCHGLNKNTNVTDGGCQNSTVCQYSTSKNKDKTFEIGKFGNATFGQYDNETKSITLLYYGKLQEHAIRSITITLKCDENGNITIAKYDMVQTSPIDNTKFTITITSKAACLLPVVVPYSTSRAMTSQAMTSTLDVTSNGSGLKTVYIVLIAVGGFVIVLAVGSYVAYKMVIKRKRSRGLLIEEEENEDYGSVPRIHVQNAALTTPVSGPV